MASVRLKIIFIVFLIVVVGGSQDVDVESLFDGRGESEDQSALIEYLESLLLHPLDVNTASAQQLSTIPWISPYVAVRIVQHRYEHGPFTGMDQLRRIRGMAADFDKTRLFLSVTPRRSVPAYFQGRHRLLAKKEEARGYRERRYAGSREKALSRFQGGYSSFVRFGFLTEKDAGEAEFDDLAVGHVQLDVEKWGTRIIAGHFSAEFAQGLVFWGPYKMGKGSDPIAPAKQKSRMLHPYLSVSENEAFFGVAFSQEIKRLGLYAFSSRSQRDARLENGFVVSTPVSGMHRTQSEIAARDRLEEKVQGGAVSYRFAKDAFLGAVFQNSEFSHPFRQKDGVEKFAFSGTKNTVAGVNFDVTFSDYNFFSETARSASGGWASNVGVLAEVQPVELALLWRRYDKDFQNLHSFGFGERDDTRNEEGIYLGFRWRPQKQTTISFYSDHYRFSWPQGALPMPASGHELLAMIEHRFQSSLKAQLRVRSEAKMDAADEFDPFGNKKKILTPARKTFVRMQMDVDASRSIRLRSRVAFSFYSGAREGRREYQPGFLLYQDILWRFAKNCRLQTRWSFFDAPMYELRFYQYENDLPGVMRMKMLAGRGSRWYGIFVYRWRKKLQATFKIEHTFYDDRDAIGSGMDAVHGAVENAAALQLDWRL